MFDRRARVLWLPFAVLIAMTGPVAGAQPSQWNTNGDNVVLDGYDVVGYFTEDRAVRGKPEVRATHDGVVFYFSSEKNRTMFLENPTHYAPSFGGFCAFGLGAQQAKAPADPETFKIYHGRLLVFFNDVHEGTKINTKILWNRDELQLWAQATAAWNAL